MSHVDLSALRMQAEPPAMPRRPLGPRLLTGGAVLLVAGVAVTFVWPLLRPVRAVAMATVRSAEAPGTNAATAVAEAVGWVEADPFPVVVRPLVAGRIETITVLEGAAVKAGETVLARLTSATLQAAHERATTELVAAERAVDAASTNRDFAAARLAQLAELRAAVVEATTDLAERDGRLAVARGAIQRTDAEHRAATAAVAAQQRLQAAGTSNELALERAVQAARATEAAHAAAQAELPATERERAAAAELLRLREELLDAPVDLQFAVRIADAELAKAAAERDTARAELTIAQRELQWTEVKAPVDGLVLKLLATPGATTSPDGEGILSLYDRAHLRARIDVPLGSVGSVAVGQEVELRSEVTGTTIVRGVVQRLQHESDLLKNTLQVKIALFDAPALWRPETLCRARFLGAADPSSTAPAAAFLVPKEAVRAGLVFVFDPARGTARAVAATVVREETEGTVVRGELSITQRVILSPVVDGEVVREEHR